MTRSESGKARWAKMSRAAKKKVLARLAKARKGRKRTKRNVSYKRAHAVSVVRLHQGKALTKHKMYKEAEPYYGKALRASRYSMRRMFEKNPRTKCEDSDPGCPHCHGSCDRKAIMTLYRSDMEDRTGTRFCEQCGGDALEAGVFSDRRNPRRISREDALKSMGFSGPLNPYEKSYVNAFVRYLRDMNDQPNPKRYGLSDERAMELSDFAVDKAGMGDNPPSRRAQAFISRKIPLLVHKEGYAVPRAVATAYKMARDRGYKTNPRIVKGYSNVYSAAASQGYPYIDSRSGFSIDRIPKNLVGVRFSRFTKTDDRDTHGINVGYKSGKFYIYNDEAFDRIVRANMENNRRNPRKKNPRMKAIMRRAQQLIRKGKSKSEALKKAFKEAKRGKRAKKNISPARLVAAARKRYEQSRALSKRASKFPRGASQARMFAKAGKYKAKMRKLLDYKGNPKSGYHKIYGRVISMKTTKGTLFPSVKTAIYGDKRNKKRLVLTGEKWTPAMAGARVLEMRAKDRNASTINGKPKRKLKSDAPSQPWRHSFRTRPKITHDKQGHIVIIGSKNLYDPKH